MQSNETLVEMWAGTVFFGILCQTGIVWFVKDKISYSIGLWLGILAALMVVLHLNKTLKRALELGENGAKRHIVLWSLVRYFVIIVLMAVIMITDFASPLAAFLGLMGIKAGAYLQPVVHRVSGKIFNKTKE